MEFGQLTIDNQWAFWSVALVLFVLPIVKMWLSRQETKKKQDAEELERQEAVRLELKLKRIEVENQQREGFLLADKAKDEIIRSLRERVSELTAILKEEQSRSDEEKEKLRAEIARLNAIINKIKTIPDSDAIQEYLKENL